jgi:outer membrane lipoprotein-sorting protein
MRFLGLSSSIIGLSIIAAGCATSTPDITKAQLISKFKQTIDPESRLKQSKTKVVVCNVDCENAKTAKLFIKAKYPDKLKKMLVLPNKGVFIEAYNGKDGWTYSTKHGVKQMKGKALDELKLQTAMVVNRGNLKKVFKSVELKGTTDIAGKECYKMVGYPNDEYNSQPITLYINKSTFLPQAKEEIFDGPKKTFPIITVWNNYKNDKGVMIPMNRMVDINGTLLDINVVSVEWNVYIDDSEFEPPVKLK